MSLKYSIPNLTTRQIVLPSDDCIGPDGDYMAYADTGDESHLRLTGSPTRWEIRPLSIQLLLTISARSGWQPEQMVAGMSDPQWAACAVRAVVAGVSGLPNGWPRPVMVQESGEKVLSWEIVRGLQADPVDGVRNMRTIVIAAIALQAELDKTLPK